MAENGTTIWIDNQTHVDLRKLAADNDRSVAGQIRFMVKNELAKINPNQLNDKLDDSGDCQE